MAEALAASAAHSQLEPFSYDPGPLGAKEVEPDADYKVRATAP